MTRVANWLAGISQKWLDRFKARHGLARTPANTAENLGRVLLHVGCGMATIADIPLTGFHTSVWQEFRLDADAAVHPDIVGTMTDMPTVETGFADAIYSSHGIEHLYWHDVPKALAEFLRVLKSDGFVVITCPDVQAAAAMIAEDRMFDTAYVSPAGPITPFDILYSYRPFVAQNPQWMSHHCGFTLGTLMTVLREAGFPSLLGFRRPAGFDLWVLASKSARSSEEMSVLAKDYLIQST
jgi:hypothetical protein